MSSQFIVSERRRSRLCDRSPSVCLAECSALGRAACPCDWSYAGRPEQSSGAKAVLTLLIAYDRSLAAGKLQTKRVLYRAAPACNADRLPNFSGLRVR